MQKYRKIETRLRDAFFIPPGCDTDELYMIAPPEFLQCDDWSIVDGVLRIGGYISGNTWPLPMREGIWVVFDAQFVYGYSIKDFQKNFIAG